ncbi:MAG: STAS domain-containing protein [Hydrogenophilus sp.]|nr:STAS domain-containing protein [Hydrogenophilus sp.]
MRQVALVGAVTIATLPEWLERYPSGKGTVVVNAEGITRCDSGVVALLIEWLRRARKEGVELRVVGLPASARALLAIYGVEDLLLINHEPQ